jgi:hypothetical protein
LSHRAALDSLPDTALLPASWVRELVRELAGPARIDGHDDVMTVDQVAALLCASPRWVRAHRVELRGFGTRKLLRFRRRTIAAWIEARAK